MANSKMLRKLAIRHARAHAGPARALQHAELVSQSMDALARLLVVVYTWRGSRPPLISARTATPQERQEYEAKP
jgi:hypothetical protein